MDNTQYYTENNRAQNDKDYPLKASKKAQEADPANTIGGKPEEVKEREDEVREEKTPAEKAPD